MRHARAARGFYFDGYVVAVERELMAGISLDLSTTANDYIVAAIVGMLLLDGHVDSGSGGFPRAVREMAHVVEETVEGAAEKLDRSPTKVRELIDAVQTAIVRIDGPGDQDLPVQKLAFATRELTHGGGLLRSRTPGSSTRSGSRSTSSSPKAATAASSFRRCPGTSRTRPRSRPPTSARSA